MSDRIDDLKRFYQKHVRDGCAARAGLFPIPEYPEHESRKGGMWSAALKIILTTLRFLAPATLLTLFWGQQSFLFRILKQIDLAIKTIIYSSEDQKESVLKWLSETGPVKVDTLDTVWHHGWIVCGVLDSAMPGACAGHPPTPLSMNHAQTIADHYLGVEPVFSKKELESEDKLSKHQEWKLAQYIERIREALSKIPTPVSKPYSQRTSPEIPQFTMDYTAKGTGLTAAQIDSKMFFKIYPSAQQSLEPGEIKVLIKGPKDKYGLAVIPPILGKAQSIRQKLLDLEQKPHFTQSTLPLIQGTTYLRSYGKNDMNKTFHIPKSQYDIKIDAEVRPEYAKVGYVVDSKGRYEIFITSRGQNILGSPFTVTASYNIIDDLEKDSFCLEDGEEIDIVDLKTDRKVVLRIVDFVSEKMLLKEDGELEKISDEEAELLMKTEKEEPDSLKETLVNNEFEDDTNKQQDKGKKIYFKLLSCKLILVLRFCRILKENKTSQENISKNYTQQSLDDRNKEIPDIINSTLNESFLEKHSISESLGPRSYEQDQKSLESEYFDTNDKSLREKENNSLDKMRSFSPNNPFREDIIRENTASTSTTSGLDFPSLDDIPIKILIEEDDTKPELVTTNPFIDLSVLEIERPKTPVLKIITGEAKYRDTIYVDPAYDTVEDSVKSNEFINPFYLHGHLRQDIEETPIADFIIGAPVSLPPIVKTSTPEPTMESIMYTCPDDSIYKPLTNNNSNNIELLTETKNVNSNVHDAKEVISKHQDDQLQNITLNRDMWDSAYVSIDDNSSPDNNNNDNIFNEQTTNKNRFSPSDMKTDKNITYMGPAEQELWESCSELTADKSKFNNSAKNIKVDLKRNVFTPIQEENDRSMSVDPKDSILAKPVPRTTDNEQVTVALAELSKAFDEYLTNSEETLNSNYHQVKTEQLFTTQIRNNRVKSASANETDVMRPKSMKLEGMISAVQSKATELDSASQCLPNSKSAIFRTEGRQSSIVLEKKKYWDQKIKEIEDISKQQPQEKKRKIIIKHTKNNDSLTRRKGKQIVKNFLQAGDNCQPLFNDTIPNTPEKHIKSKLVHKECEEQIKNEEKNMNDIKLQNNLEKTSALTNHKQRNETKTDKTLDMNAKGSKNFSFFKDKYEPNFRKEDIVTKTEKASYNSSSTSKTKQEKTKFQSFDIPKAINVEKETNEQSYTNKKIDGGCSLKQDYTEEVFKAFENCPKRFFGTSRKRILNKIDSFLGLNKSTEETPSFTDIPKESGIVSNRVTLFHNISNVEELVWKRKNYQNSKIENITNKQEKVKAENSFQIKDASTEVQKEPVDLKSTKAKILGSKLDKFDSNNKDSSHLAKTSIITKKKEINKLNDIVKTQADLKSQVNEAIRSLKLNDTGCDAKLNDSPVIKNTTKTVEPIKSNLNNVQSKLNSMCSSHKIIKPENILRKSSFSRSDMDIFNKVNQTVSAGDLDKHKSYDELPKINVKNFISIYETASKSTERPKSVLKKTQRLKNKGLEKDDIVGDNKVNPRVEDGKIEMTSVNNSLDSPQPPLRLKRAKSLSKEKISSQKIYETPSNPVNNAEQNYISLNDIDIEIIEKPAEIITEFEPETNDDFTDPIDYKSRFNKAKDFFKSLEELRENRPVKKEKACTTSIESLDTETQQTTTQTITKANSLQSSELTKIWDKMNLTQNDSNKLIKISEKFQVDDLFNDVVEGKLSRQGSLRGIPHKKAVLETFKSMENVSEPKLSPYEISISQLADFAKKNNIKNAQTYLTEYPYLPTTEPSKYHSRIDTKATGLISLKELVNSKPRRNSVPDLRIVSSSTVDI